MTDYASLITLMGDRILVEPEPPSKVTDGGLVLPDNVESAEASRLRVSRVLAIGPGRPLRTEHRTALLKQEEMTDEQRADWMVNKNKNDYDHPTKTVSWIVREAMEVKVGERVVHLKHVGEQILLNGHALIVMGDRDITGVLPEGVQLGSILTRSRLALPK